MLRTGSPASRTQELQIQPQGMCGELGDPDEFRMPLKLTEDLLAERVGDLSVDPGCSGCAYGPGGRQRTRCRHRRKARPNTAPETVAVM